MSTSRQGSAFYVTGGTLKPDAPSYIERQADRELYESCLTGEFCWVLTTRQMGKSSLMARTAQRLQADGVHTAIVDLSLKSKKEGAVSADQWYYGIAHTLLRELGISASLGDWWQERTSLPAVQCFLELFRDVILSSVDGRLVVFFDEIDSTLDLRFSDDFFAALRGCYNARATDEAFERLTLVLLGTASPSELIKDPTRTPFNIGRGIELTDFTLEEAQPLAQGFGAEPQASEALLRRVLHWTGGHPYLTQKLCRAVAKKTRGSAPALPETLVDSLAREIFVDEREARQEANLRFVAHRLRSESPRKSEVLRTYRRVLRGKRVEDEPQSAVHAELKLSGVVERDLDGRLQVRNRIYREVFTPAWVQKELPTDRRLFVAATAVLLSVAGLLYWYFLLLPRSYIQTLQTASQDVEVAYQSYDRLHALPFREALADELLARFWERRGDRDRALLTRIEALTRGDTETPRRAIGRLLGDDYQLLRRTYRHGGAVSAVAFGPGGDELVTDSRDRGFELWSLSSGEPLGPASDGPAAPPESPTDEVRAVSLQGDAAVTGGQDGTARVWSTSDGEPLTPPLLHSAPVEAVAFNPQGDAVLTGSRDTTARLWSATSEDPLTPPLGQGAGMEAVDISPRGDAVVTGSRESGSRVWGTAKGDPWTPPLRHDGWVLAVAFSPDGDEVVTGGSDGSARVWSATSGEPQTRLLGHEGWVVAVDFSPLGDAVVTGSADKTARIWSTENGELRTSLLGHEGWVVAVAFSPRGDAVVTGSLDTTARIWSTADGAPLTPPLQHDDRVFAVAFTPRGDAVLTGSSDGTARVWSVTSGRALTPPLQLGAPVREVGFWPAGDAFFVRSGSWAHRFSFDGARATHEGSRFLSGRNHPIRIAVECPSCLEMFRLDIAKRVIVDFAEPRSEPVEGDPDELLRDWQQRLALTIDNGRISPMWPLPPKEPAGAQGTAGSAENDPADRSQ